MSARRTSLFDIANVGAADAPPLSNGSASSQSGPIPPAASAKSASPALAALGSNSSNGTANASYSASAAAPPLPNKANGGGRTLWDGPTIKRRIHKLYAIALSHGDALYYQGACDAVEGAYRAGKRRQHRERLVENRRREILAIGKDKPSATAGPRLGTTGGGGSATATVTSAAGQATSTTAASGRAATFGSSSTSTRPASPAAPSIRQQLLEDDQQWGRYEDFEAMAPSVPLSEALRLRRRLLVWKRFDAFIEACGFYEGSASAAGVTPLFCRRAWIRQVMASREAEGLAEEGDATLLSSSAAAAAEVPEPRVPSAVFLFDKVALAAAGLDAIPPIPIPTTTSAAAVSSNVGVYVGGLQCESLSVGVDHQPSLCQTASSGRQREVSVAEPVLMGRRPSAAAWGGGGVSSQRRQSERVVIPRSRASPAPHRHGGQSPSAGVGAGLRSGSRVIGGGGSPSRSGSTAGANNAVFSAWDARRASRASSLQGGAAVANNTIRSGSGSVGPSPLLTCLAVAAGAADATDTLRSLTNVAPPLNAVAVQSTPFFSGAEASDVFIRSARNDEEDAARLASGRQQAPAHSPLTAAQENKYRYMTAGASVTHQQHQQKQNGGAPSNPPSPPSSPPRPRHLQREDLFDFDGVLSHSATLTPQHFRGASPPNAPSSLGVAVGFGEGNRSGPSVGVANANETPFRSSSLSHRPSVHFADGFSGLTAHAGPMGRRGSRGVGSEEAIAVGLAVPPPLPSVSTDHFDEEAPDEDDFPFAAISRYRFTRIIVEMVERLMAPPGAAGGSSAAPTAGGSAPSTLAFADGGGGGPSFPHAHPHLSPAYQQKALAFPSSPSQQERANADYDSRFTAAWGALYDAYFQPLEQRVSSVAAIGDVMACANAGLAAPLALRVPQRVVYHLISTHLEWLLMPLFDRYCAYGCGYVSRAAFLAFAADLKLGDVDAELAAGVFEKTNQFDTEGMLEGQKLDNLEFDEFIDAVLLLGCAQFADSEAFPTLVTSHAKVWEAFRILRRRFGEATPFACVCGGGGGGEGEGYQRRDTVCTTATSTTSPLPRVLSPHRGYRRLSLVLSASSGGRSPQAGAAAATPCHITAPWTGPCRCPASRGAIVCSFTDRNVSYARERRRPRVSISLPTSTSPHTSASGGSAAPFAFGTSEGAGMGTATPTTAASLAAMGSLDLFTATEQQRRIMRRQSVASAASAVSGGLVSPWGAPLSGASVSSASASATPCATFGAFASLGAFGGVVMTQRDILAFIPAPASSPTASSVSMPSHWPAALASTPAPAPPIQPLGPANHHHRGGARPSLPFDGSADVEGLGFACGDAGATERGRGSLAHRASSSNTSRAGAGAKVHVAMRRRAAAAPDEQLGVFAPPARDAAERRRLLVMDAFPAAVAAGYAAPLGRGHAAAVVGIGRGGGVKAEEGCGVGASAVGAPLEPSPAEVQRRWDLCGRANADALLSAVTLGSVVSPMAPTPSHAHPPHAGARTLFGGGSPRAIGPCGGAAVVGHSSLARGPQPQPLSPSSLSCAAPSSLTAGGEAAPPAPILPAQLTLVCPRHLCIDDMDSFLVGGVFFPNLEALPGAEPTITVAPPRKGASPSLAVGGGVLRSSLSTAATTAAASSNRRVLFSSGAEEGPSAAAESSDRPATSVGRSPRVSLQLPPSSSSGGEGAGDDGGLVVSPRRVQISDAEAQQPPHPPARPPIASSPPADLPRRHRSVSSSASAQSRSLALSSSIGGGIAVFGGGGVVGSAAVTDPLVSPIGILAKAARVGEAIGAVAPSEAMIDAVQRRETPGTGGGLLPCAGYTVAPPRRTAAAAGFRGDVTQTSLSRLCPVAVLLGPSKVVGRAVQIARNRWRVTIPPASVSPHDYLPVIEVLERTAATEKSLMASCYAPPPVAESAGDWGNAGSGAFGFGGGGNASSGWFDSAVNASGTRGPSTSAFGFGGSSGGGVGADDRAFTIRTRPTQCWRVQLAAKEGGGAYVSPSPAEHTVHLELRAVTDRLTQHQSRWLRALFYAHADSDSGLLTLSQFREHVLPAFATFPIIVGVAETLVRTEPLLYPPFTTAIVGNGSGVESSGTPQKVPPTSQHIDAPRSALEELFVRFCTTEQLSQVRLKATAEGTLSIWHIPADGAAPLNASTHTYNANAMTSHGHGGSFAPTSPASAAAAVSKRRWRVAKLSIAPEEEEGEGAGGSSPPFGGGGALVSGLRRSIVVDDGGIVIDATNGAYIDREGVSITGFVCFLLYAILGKKALGGLDQSPIAYADALEQMMPSAAKERTVWLSAAGIDAALATPRWGRTPHQRAEAALALEQQQNQRAHVSADSPLAQPSGSPSKGGKKGKGAEKNAVTPKGKGVKSLAGARLPPMAASALKAKGIAGSPAPSPSSPRTPRGGSVGGRSSSVATRVGTANGKGGANGGAERSPRLPPIAVEPREAYTVATGGDFIPSSSEVTAYASAVAQRRERREENIAALSSPTSPSRPQSGAVGSVGVAGALFSPRPPSPSIPLSFGGMGLSPQSARPPSGSGGLSNAMLGTIGSASARALFSWAAPQQEASLFAPTSPQRAAFVTAAPPAVHTLSTRDTVYAISDGLGAGAVAPSPAAQLAMALSGYSAEATLAGLRAEHTRLAMSSPQSSPQHKGGAASARGVRAD